MRAIAACGAFSAKLIVASCSSGSAKPGAIASAFSNICLASAVFPPARSARPTRYGPRGLAGASSTVFTNEA